MGRGGGLVGGSAALCFVTKESLRRLPLVLTRHHEPAQARLLNGCRPRAHVHVHQRALAHCNDVGPRARAGSRRSGVRRFVRVGLHGPCVTRTAGPSPRTRVCEEAWEGAPRAGATRRQSVSPSVRYQSRPLKPYATACFASHEILAVSSMYVEGPPGGPCWPRIMATPMVETRNGSSPAAGAPRGSGAGLGEHRRTGWGGGGGGMQH